MLKRRNINLLVILIVGIGMPAYYKIKFLLLEIVTLNDILNWTLPVEILFGISLASLVVFGHDHIVKILRKKMPESRGLNRFMIQYLISSFYAVISAIAFSILFWDFIMKMPMTAEYIFDYAILGLFIPLLVNGVSESMYFYGKWEKETQVNEELEKENIKSKYEILQNQISPHFLFNCFNTLAVLINESKKTASQFLHQLSKVYRYVLEIKDTEVVSMKEEFEALSSYIALMKYRFGNSFDVKFHNSLSNLDFHLAPLTLQMLLENALKHNQFDKEKPLHININQTAGYLTFQNEKTKLIKAESTKTGLKNLSKRYKHLTGKNIKVEDTEKEFKVKVPLIEIGIA